MEYCTLGDLSMFIKKKGEIGHEGRRFGNRTVKGIDDDALLIGQGLNLKGEIGQAPENRFNLAGKWGGLQEIVVRHFLGQLGLLAI
jgi:hypothetical protein